jgi:hypothetical protein
MIQLLGFFQSSLNQNQQCELFYNAEDDCFSLKNDPEGSCLSKELMDCIVKKLIEYQSTKLLQQITEAIEKIGPFFFESNRCPHIFFKLTETRSLCITIIPSQHVIDTKQNICAEFCIGRDEHITNYYGNAFFMNQINPENTVPFFLIPDFHSHTLVISEGIMNYYNRNPGCPTPYYLQTKENIKHHLIDPCLNTIKNLHDNDYYHGDPHADNIILPMTINKILFFDFKHVSKEHHDKNLAKLIDFYDISKSIIIYMEALGYENNLVLFYLKKIMHVLEKFIEEKEELEILFIGLTIDKMKEDIDFFWNLPDHIFNYVPFSEIASYRPLVSVLSYDHSCNKFTLDDYPDDQALSHDLVKKIKNKIKFNHDIQVFELTKTRKISAQFTKNPNGSILHEYRLTMVEINDDSHVPQTKKQRRSSFKENLQMLQQDLTKKMIQSDSTDPLLLSLSEKIDFYRFFNDFPDIFMDFSNLANEAKIKFCDMMISDFSAYIPKNLTHFYLEKMRSLFQQGSNKFFYSKSFKDIQDCIHLFWEMTSDSVLCYDDTKLNDKQIRLINNTYIQAVTNNETTIMRFYEECYPDYVDINFNFIDSYSSHFAL